MLAVDNFHKQLIRSRSFFLEYVKFSDYRGPYFSNQRARQPVIRRKQIPTKSLEEGPYKEFIGLGGQDAVCFDAVTPEIVAGSLRIYDMTPERHGVVRQLVNCLAVPASFRLRALVSILTAPL